MYEELVKRLRDYAASRKGEIAELTAGAADAIEELSKELIELKMLTCCCCEPPKEENK